MSTFQLPLGLCKELDKIVKRFWWNAKPSNQNYLALKAWEELCLPCDQGGLDFRLFSEFNIALLTKLA